MNKGNEEITVDLNQIKNIIKEKFIILLAIIIVCTIIATIISFLVPKVYKSNTLIRINAVNKNMAAISNLLDMAADMGISTGQTNIDPTVSYIELIKSRRVIQPVIDNLDIAEDKKENITVEGFIKSNLNISNESKTDLININAYGSTPEEAQYISQAVTDSFISMISEFNQSDNAYLSDFLNKRTEETKKDMEAAENKLNEYQREHKIYEPTEQTNVLIKQLGAYDDNIAQLQAQLEANSAKLSDVSGQLQEQNSSLLEYQVSDDENIGKLRNDIVNKRVELVGLEQRYTNEHPDVIRCKQELDKLMSSLNDEVTRAVNSQSYTVTAAQGALLQAKSLAEVDISVANVSLETLKSKRNELESQVDTLSADSVEYIRLLRDKENKTVLYNNLLKSKEQANIQGAINAVDIQIVDEANLPSINSPEKPDKKIYILIGFSVGILLSMAYVMYISFSRNKI